MSETVKETKAGRHRKVADPKHKNCHHEGGDLFRKSAIDGSHKTNRWYKLRRKQNFLRQMISQGANKYEITRKAHFMGMKSDEFAYLLKEVRSEE